VVDGDIVELKKMLVLIFKNNV